MTALTLVNKAMPTLRLKINGHMYVIEPNKNNETTIPFTNGQRLVISTENTGIDGQVEDVMYKGRYLDDAGNTQPGSHTYGSIENLTSGLTNLITALSKQGINLAL